ncbi:hypothetical protein SMG44B_10050 [Stenotrophomonas maltophilia]
MILMHRQWCVANLGHPQCCQGAAATRFREHLLREVAKTVSFISEPAQRFGPSKFDESR